VTALPEKIGKYEIQGILGRGGMGAVYEAENRGSGEVVAVKVLSAQFGDDAALRRRFDIEIETLKALRKTLSLTQRDLAEALEQEVDTVRGWERGELFPTKSAVSAMAALKENPSLRQPLADALSVGRATRPRCRERQGTVQGLP
jgi:DNA-binding transcriptional regulator YiaG